MNKLIRKFIKIKLRKKCLEECLKSDDCSKCKFGYEDAECALLRVIHKL